MTMPGFRLTSVLTGKTVENITCNPSASPPKQRNNGEKDRNRRLFPQPASGLAATPVCGDEEQPHTGVAALDLHAAFERSIPFEFLALAAPSASKVATRSLVRRTASFNASSIWTYPCVTD